VAQKGQRQRGDPESFETPPETRDKDGGFRDHHLHLMLGS